MITDVSPPAMFGSEEGVHAMLLDADGFVVTVGYASSAWAVLRHLGDGTLDASFGTGGVVATPVNAYGGQAQSVARQSDGRLVVAGWTWESSFAARDAVVVRYEADGSIDTTFGTDGMVVAPAVSQWNAVLVQPDGDIVVAGLAEGAPGFALARYDVDGTPDVAFGGTGTVTTATAYAAEAIVLQPDGQVVASGGGLGQAVLARYAPDGTLDATFGSGGIALHDWFTGASGRLLLQPDGRLLLSGVVRHMGFPSVARFEPHGSVDGTFAPCVAAQFVFADRLADSGGIGGLALQPDGRIVALGTTDDSRFGVVRLGTPFVTTGCQPPAPAGARIVAKSGGGIAANGKFAWKWRGAPVLATDFGDPTVDPGMLLCLLDRTAPVPTPIFTALGPGSTTCDSGPCWKARIGGFRFKTYERPSYFGSQRFVLKAGATGDGTLVVRGKGNEQNRLQRPVPTPLGIRLARADGAACWDSTFTTPDRNELGILVATSD